MRAATWHPHMQQRVTAYDDRRDGCDGACATTPPRHRLAAPCLRADLPLAVLEKSFSIQRSRRPQSFARSESLNESGLPNASS